MAFSFLVATLGIALSIPAIVVTIEAIASRIPMRGAGSRAATARHTGSLAILVPAHNEAEVIRDTLAHLRTSAPSDARIVVIADNCTDETASLALTAGAEVSVRVDAARRGKGYALEHGLNFLADQPPDVVAVIDADCRIEGEALQRLANAAFETGRPAQLQYDMLPPPRSAPGARLGWFAWTFKGTVRARGAKALGAPAQLLGTGMAFPWHVLQKAVVGTDEIVEDVKLGVDLSIAGFPSIFLPYGRVLSSFPSASEALLGQRKRWEQGHLSIIRREVPRLLFESIRQRRVDLLLQAADLAVPPLSLTVISHAVGVTLLWGCTFLGASKLGFAVSAASFCLLILSIVDGWWRFASDELSVRELLRAPGYALKKVPLYIASLAGKGKRDWNRTSRQ